MSSPAVRSVVFDAVGTLLVPNPSPAEVYARIADRHGLSVTPDEITHRFTEAHRRENEADRIAGWATSESRERERWRRIVTAVLSGLPDGGFEELWEYFARASAWEVPIEGARAVEHLTSWSVPLGIASNFDRRLHSVLAGLPELAPVRERAVISSEVGVRKPHRDFFFAVAERMACAVTEILLVGDDYENDYLAATAVGMPAVLYDPLAHHPALERRIESLTDVLTLVRRPGRS